MTQKDKARPPWKSAKRPKGAAGAYRAAGLFKEIDFANFFYARALSDAFQDFEFSAIVKVSSYY
jgi:hypothetical protein